MAPTHNVETIFSSIAKKKENHFDIKSESSETLGDVYHTAGRPNPGPAPNSAVDLVATS